MLLPAPHCIWVSCVLVTCCVRAVSYLCYFVCVQFVSSWVCMQSCLYHAMGPHGVVCALYLSDTDMCLIHIMYHIPYCVHICTISHIPYYVSESCCMFTQPCVCTCGLLSLLLEDGAGISALTLCLPAPQLCCIPASCQHLCLGTRAAALLVRMGGWGSFSQPPISLSSTGPSCGRCLAQH